MNGCNAVRGMTMHGCNAVRSMTMHGFHTVRSMTNVTAKSLMEDLIFQILVFGQFSSRYWAFINGRALNLDGFMGRA